MNIEFKEEQKFTQWWFWLLLIPLGLVPVLGIYKQLIQGEPFGEQPMSDVGLIVFFIGMMGFIGLLVMIKLSTTINKVGIEIRFFPFMKKTINWKDIKNKELITYGFVGGWGIRLWTKYGTVYNVKGNKGLAIELKNGKKLLIGTQKETELAYALKKLSDSEIEYI